MEQDKLLKQLKSIQLKLNLSYEHEILPFLESQKPYKLLLDDLEEAIDQLDNLVGELEQNST